MALSRREKGLLMGLGALAVALPFYLWVHSPLLAHRTEARAASEQVRKELTRDEASLKREGDLKSRQAAVAARESLLDAWVPGKNSAALLIWYLSVAEAHSGAHIRSVQLSDKRLVSVASSGTKEEPATGLTLAVIRLDMRVEGRFTQHLLFDQALDEMPLFLDIPSLSLAKSAGVDLDQVSRLVAEGRTGMATQLLGTSPALTGSYQIDLYFKAETSGPSTEVMRFAEATGRMDPFAMDQVDAFIQMLADYYANLRFEESSRPGDGFDLFDLPVGPGEQMG